MTSGSAGSAPEKERICNKHRSAIHENYPRLKMTKAPLALKAKARRKRRALSDAIYRGRTGGDEMGRQLLHGFRPGQAAWGEARNPSSSWCKASKPSCLTQPGLTGNL